MIDGILFIAHLLGSNIDQSVGLDEMRSIDMVNRHWQSHYKIKGNYPVYPYGQQPPLQPGQGMMAYRTNNQDQVVVYDDPSFQEGVWQGASWLGVDLNGKVQFSH